ncbi:hypothetical protein IWW57_002165 [Coemansia sp. S610]|nr:hypothetical protein IWW57_002165 [Coemansia sp. S610]
MDEKSRPTSQRSRQYVHSDAPQSQGRTGKPLSRAKRITQAIADSDLATLRHLARTSDGFQTIRLRRRAW